MEFTIECPKCNQHYSVTESFIGQIVECSVCGNTFALKVNNNISRSIDCQETPFMQTQQKSQITTSNPVILCPFCKQSYEVEPDVIGKKVQCSVCNESFVAHRNRARHSKEHTPQRTRIPLEQKTYRPDKAQQTSNDQERYMLPPQGQMQSVYGIPQNQSFPQQQVVYIQVPSKAKSRGVYVMLGVFLGALGVHNFYAGHIARGVAHLCLGMWFFLGFLVRVSRAEDPIDVSFAFLNLFIVFLVNSIWAIVEIITIKNDSKGIPME